jgi:hypothetical protein
LQEFFDHLIGGGQQRFRDGEAEKPTPEQLKGLVRPDYIYRVFG